MIRLENKDLRNRTPFSNTIDSVLYKKLKDYSKETGIPISEILDRALEDYLDYLKRHEI